MPFNDPPRAPTPAEQVRARLKNWERCKRFVVPDEGCEIAYGELVAVEVGRRPSPNDLLVCEIPGTGLVIRRLRLTRGEAQLITEGGIESPPVPVATEGVTLLGVVVMWLDGIPADKTGLPPWQ